MLILIKLLQNQKKMHINLMEIQLYILVMRKLKNFPIIEIRFQLVYGLDMIPQEEIFYQLEIMAVLTPQGV